VSFVSFGELQQLVSAHGYWVVALIVGLESMGLPLPGETILVLAAIYAATEPSFNVWVVIAVAAFGAIVATTPLLARTEIRLRAPPAIR
jgi:membrane protein DedA with SNARE-associated domain